MRNLSKIILCLSVLALCTVTHARFNDKNFDPHGCESADPIGPVGKDGGNGPVGKDGGNIVDGNDCSLQGKDSGNFRGDGQTGEVKLVTCVDSYDSATEMLNHKSQLFTHWGEALDLVQSDERTKHLFYPLQNLAAMTSVCITEDFEDIERKNVGTPVVDEFRPGQWQRLGPYEYHVDLDANWLAPNIGNVDQPMARTDQEIMKGLAVELLHPWFAAGKRGELYHHAFVEALFVTKNIETIVDIMGKDERYVAVPLTNPTQACDSLRLTQDIDEALKKCAGVHVNQEGKEKEHMGTKIRKMLNNQNLRKFEIELEQAEAARNI